MDHCAGYCGLHCENCHLRAHVGPDAQRLVDSMKRAGFEQFGPMIPGFAGFWEFLSRFAAGNGCFGCRAEGGNPHCRVRACAREKSVDACALCAEYPCREMDAALAHYPMLEADNRFLREKGTEAWLAMQQQRRAQGYTYALAKES